MPGKRRLIQLFRRSAGTTSSLVPHRSVHQRSYSSVSGDIEIGKQARVRDAKTVSGDIDVDDGSQYPNSEICSVYVEAKANARLRIHRSASVGQ